MTILYVDRNRLQFFQAGWSSVLSLDLPETVIADLDVVNHTELQRLLKSFFHEHTLRPSPMLFVLSEATYFLQVLTGEESAKDQQLEEWIGMVPFESVHVKRYTVNGQDVAIVVPKNFIEMMEQILVEEGFQVMGIVPAFALGSPIAEKRWLDEAMGTFVLKEVNRLVRQSILERSKSFTPPVSLRLGGKNQRLMIFISLFVFLLFLLIFLIFRPS